MSRHISKDSFGDRMKFLEGMEAQRKLMPQLPILVRLDGKGFSKFTKGLRRPFDERLQELMQKTTKHLVQETNAAFGFTQSDEISLVILTSRDSEPYFGGRVQKICSLLAASCSVYFNSHLVDLIPEKCTKFPIFDARVWNAPTEWEAANTILWRHLDAQKNSVQMLAQHYFSHKSLQGLHGGELKEKLLSEKSVDWNSFPNDFKGGAYFRRITTERLLTQEELLNLPEKHAARKDPLLPIKRSHFSKVSFPDLVTIKNLPEVLFHGGKPVPKTP